MVAQKCCGIIDWTLGHVHLQTQADRRGMNHLWRNKDDLQVDYEFFETWDMS